MNVVAPMWGVSAWDGYGINTNHPLDPEPIPTLNLIPSTRTRQPPTRKVEHASP